MTATLTNPLLEPGALPAFSKITPPMIQPAIEQLIGNNRNAIARLSAQERPDWDNLIKPLSLMNDRLEKAWSPVRHLNSVKSTPELRDAYNSCLPLLSEYSTEVSQNRNLYQGYRRIAESLRRIHPGATKSRYRCAFAFPAGRCRTRW
jgi:oligopeptidase A